MSENLVSYLLDIGCCYNCCSRYTCAKNVDFENADLCTIKKLCSENNDVPVKKPKENPCIVCLGLLQNFTIDDVLCNQSLALAKEYDSEVFTCSISMPASVIIREHSLKIHLKDKYPEYFDDDKEELQLNKAWKALIKTPLSQFTSKVFENSETCNFSINIVLDYENDNNELSVLSKMQPKIFEERKTQHRKYNGGLFSRKVVLSVLPQIPLAVFKDNTTVPPMIPDTGLFCKSIECKHNSIYLAGRYCKFSRELSQSPWIIDGVKTMETSVQEIIFKGIHEEFGIEDASLKFSSSGREDCDVRCLGKGRPFYIEIMNPKKTKYTFEDCRKIENQINQSTLLKVQDMQLVDKCDLTNIKAGEESKTKEYVALCVTKSPISEELMNKINSIESLDIEQKTPIRVLHRRPLASRKKKIHKIEAKVIADKPNMFELHVETQAGTYVKEFVHGDFGRTTPSVCEILDIEVDILALDVVAIKLDWPKAIDYNKITE